MDKRIPNLTLAIPDRTEKSPIIMNLKAVLTDLETKQTTELLISDYLASAEFTATDFQIEALCAGTEYVKTIHANISPVMPGYSYWYFSGDNKKYINELKCYLEILPATIEMLETKEAERIENLGSFGTTDLKTPLEDVLTGQQKQTNAEIQVFNDEEYKVLRLTVLVAETFYNDLLKSIELNRLKDMYLTLKSEKIVWEHHMFGVLSEENLHFLVTDTRKNFPDFNFIQGHCHIRVNL